jgi:ATP-binding cassette, subfamily B, bacterial
VRWLGGLGPFVRPRRRQLVAAVAMAVLSIGMTAAAPLVMAAIVDRAVDAAGGSITPWLVALLGLGAVRALGAAARKYAALWVTTHIDADVRTAIFDKLQRLDFSIHDRVSTGQLVSRANTDVQLLEGIISQVPLQASNVLLLLITLVIMGVLSPALTLISLLVVPAMLVVAWRMNRVLYPSGFDAQMRAAEVADVVENAITGVRVVKGFGLQQRMLQRLVDQASVYYGTRVRNMRIQAAFGPALGALASSGQVLVLGLGGFMVLRGDLSLGVFLAFLTYLAQMESPIQNLAGFAAQLQNSRGGVERVLEILQTDARLAEPTDPTPLPRRSGRRLELDGVSFGYGRTTVLHDVSLVVEPGETVAIVGASGSGKTTVAMLLPRFYDAASGTVRLDGIDVRDLAFDDLRRTVGMVFQDSLLFSESVLDNIRYARPEATMAEVEAAAEAAGAADFIAALPEGYDTIVGEQGFTLSGGQRQRVAIARALLANPPVLVLDDATSAVDSATERTIHGRLADLLPGRTTVIIAHRRSTLELADRIVVLDEGRVDDTGTMDELVERSPLFRSLLSGEGALRHRDPVLHGAWDEFDADLEDQPFMVANDEMLEKVAALPPVRDVPDPAIVERERGDHETFSLRHFVHPYRMQLALAFAIVVTLALFTLAGPAIIRYGVDRGVQAGERGPVLAATAAFSVAMLITYLTRRAATVYTGRVGQDMLFGLRVRIFSQIQRLSMDYFEREMRGRIMTRMTSDIEVLQQLFQNGLVQTVVSAVLLVGTTGALFAMDTGLAAVSMLVLIPLTAATLWFRAKERPAWVNVRDRIADVNASLQETISGVRVVQASVRADENRRRFIGKTEAFAEARMRTVLYETLYFPFVEFLSLAAITIVLAAGAPRVEAGTLTAGELFAFVLYITVVFGPIQQLSNVFEVFQRSSASVEKFKELTETPVTVEEPADPVSPARIRGELELRGVRFRYPLGSDDALQGVDLVIPAGQTVAVVGATGGGKSTLVKLLLRFYDPTEGEVLLDGVPLRSLDPTLFRGVVGYVPQEPFLVAGSVADNIAFADPDAGHERIELAARAVGAHDLIARFEHGYLTEIGERGGSLSAGERQLLALARAQLVDPTVLLLDEPTSNLDLVSESAVTAAMHAVMAERTTILVAHRLQTAATADRILVVDQGRIVEDGSPDELRASGGRFARLWQTYIEGSGADTIDELVEEATAPA